MTVRSGSKSWVSCISFMLYNWSLSWPPFPRWEAQHKGRRANEKSEVTGGPPGHWIVPAGHSIASLTAMR